MGKIVKDRIIYGGIDSALQNKVGSAPLDTVAQDLSGAVNELKATGGGTITDVQVDGTSVVTSGVAEIDLTSKADAATTLSGYGITDANINNGTITLGSNTITPLTSHQDISGKVDKAGDTMTGNLTIQGASKSLIFKNPSVTINTSSNNGVTSDTGNTIVIKDNNNVQYGQFYVGASTDGGLQANITLTNKKTNGSSVYNSIALYANKDGTLSYAIGDSAAFRNAINAGKADTIATGDSNGQIKVTPQVGNAYNVSVKGLGSAAYVNADTAASNNTIAKRTANGYIYATYFNQSSGAETPTTSSYAFYCNSDGFLRKSSMANMRSALGLGSLATLSSIANYITIGEVSVDNFSIAANNSAQTSNIATTKSGWTAVHIIGVSLQNASSSGTLYSWCVPYQVNMNSSKQVNAQIRNYYTGGAAKIKVIFRILYIK